MDAQAAAAWEAAKNAVREAADLVEIIGEQVIEYEGRVLDQYLYNIVGYTPKNGKPFMALKSNIFTF